MSLNGHAACPTGERCFLIMGKLLAPDGQNWFLIPARYIHIFRVQPTHAIPAIWQFLSSANHPDGIPLICKPSRQLADNREIVNCLFVRILRQKTRWSDSFSQFLFLLRIKRHLQLLLISINIDQFRQRVTWRFHYQWNRILHSVLIKSSRSEMWINYHFSRLIGFLDKILTLGNVNKFPFLSLNRIFALSVNKISGTSG